MATKSIKAEFLKGLWEENPVFRQLLGLCPTLAVTGTVITGIAMGLATTFVLIFSSLVVASIKKLIPAQVRIATYIVIIASFVTIADQFLKAFFFSTFFMKLRASSGFPAFLSSSACSNSLDIEFNVALLRIYSNKNFNWK